MNKQQFIATIPILDEKTLKKAAYIYADYPERSAVESYFPAIPMIRHNIDPTAEISVIVILPRRGTTSIILKLFYKELSAVSVNLTWTLLRMSLKFLFHMRKPRKSTQSFL